MKLIGLDRPETIKKNKPGWIIFLFSILLPVFFIISPTAKVLMSGANISILQDIYYEAFYNSIMILGILLNFLLWVLLRYNPTFALIHVTKILLLSGMAVAAALGFCILLIPTVLLTYLVVLLGMSFSLLRGIDYVIMTIYLVIPFTMLRASFILYKKIIALFEKNALPNRNYFLDGFIYCFVALCLTFIILLIQFPAR